MNCLRCNTLFGTTQQLRKHLERKVKCVDLNNVTIEAALLVAKARVRKTSDTLECYVCRKTFLRVSNLNKHITRCSIKNTEYNEETKLEEVDLLKNMEDIQSDVSTRLASALESHDDITMQTFKEDCHKVAHRLGRYMDNFGAHAKISEAIEVLSQAIISLGGEEGTKQFEA